MKQLLVLMVAATLFSCQNSSSKKEYQKSDTVFIVANGDKGIFMDSAIRIRGAVRAFADSNSLNGKLVQFTAYRIGQLTDTARDSLRRPIQDSAHHYTVRLFYPPQSVDTSFNDQIQVVKFPKRKK